MTGPTLEVLIRSKIPKDHFYMLETQLKLNAKEVKHKNGRWEFHTSEASCLCSFHAKPFISEYAVFDGSRGFHEPGGLVFECLTTLGYVPEQIFEFNNFCRSDTNGHIALAEIALIFAERFDGLITVGNAIESWPYLNRHKTEGNLVFLETADLYEDYVMNTEAFAQWIKYSGFYLQI